MFAPSQAGSEPLAPMRARLAMGFDLCMPSTNMRTELLRVTVARGSRIQLYRLDQRRSNAAAFKVVDALAIDTGLGHSPGLANGMRDDLPIRD
jgi:hypothetical protein